MLCLLASVCHASLIVCRFMPRCPQVFTWDSGNNIGEIAGHAKKIIAVGYKWTRPFRLITGGEDNVRVVFCEHANFVFCIP